MRAKGLLSGSATALFCALHSATGAAVVFTNDTVINSYDQSYDGQDIVVTNCTLAVDGPRGFLSLLVQSGGTLTHSFAPAGSVTVQRSFQDEPQILTSTNPVSLLNTGDLQYGRDFAENAGFDFDLADGELDDNEAGQQDDVAPDNGAGKPEGTLWRWGRWSRLSTTMPETCNSLSAGGSRMAPNSLRWL